MQRSAPRHLAVLAGIVALLTFAPAAAARTGPVELGAAASNYGLFVDPDVRYQQTLALYDAITPETATKIFDLQHDRDVFTFGPADAIVNWADAHGQKVHGHTLAWCADTSLPAWLLDRNWTRSELLGVLQKHITTVLNHYRGRIPSWDVVNEAFNADGSLRDCVWLRDIGPDWVEQAFRFARAADPNVRLFYNEVRAEVPNPKLEAILAMVRDFRERGVPIDGVGLQMHLTTDAPPQDQMEEAIRRLGELGLDVHISEMDVPTWYLGPTLEEKLARQADSYRRVAAACQAQPACFRITTWGFTDRYTWRGTSSMPLPFDAEYQPKPAWTALLEVLRPPAPPPPPTPVVTAASVPAPTVFARVLRRRLATLLRSRQLRLAVQVSGGLPAHLVVAARLRGHLIARLEQDVASAGARVVRLRLTASDRRRLRRAGRARLVITIALTGPDGQHTGARLRAPLR